MIERAWWLRGLVTLAGMAGIAVILSLDTQGPPNEFNFALVGDA